MDSVLTRKMFRDRYFKSLKPKVKHFQQGGLSSLTPKEKAIYAATFAAPLLSSTQRQGESAISGVARAFGEGFAKLPATAISIAEAREKNKKTTEQLRSATAQEKIDLGYNPKDRLIVKTKDGVVTGIADKPTFGEREKAADRQATMKQADKILSGLEKFSTGPFEGRFQKLTAALNMNPGGAAFDVAIAEFKKSAIKALRGAQVGPLEEASFNALLPDITDSEDVIRAKINTMKDKIAEIDGRLDSSGRVSDPGNVDYYQEAFANFNISPEDINYDNTLDFYVVEDGELVKR